LEPPNSVNSKLICKAEVEGFLVKKGSRRYYPLIALACGLDICCAWVKKTAAGVWRGGPGRQKKK